jgi:excisionase family DNA binding protein
LLLCAILCLFKPTISIAGLEADMAATNAAEPQSFLTPQEVSSLLRVSVYTVRRWIKEGSLPAYKVGRGWRISKTEIGEWLEENQSQAAMLS